MCNFQNGMVGNDDIFLVFIYFEDFEWLGNIYQRGDVLYGLNVDLVVW